MNARVLEHCLDSSIILTTLSLLKSWGSIMPNRKHFKESKTANGIAKTHKLCQTYKHKKTWAQAHLHKSIPCIVLVIIRYHRATCTIFLKIGPEVLDKKILRLSL